jgi:predicted DsbA family dithiol-disulfide isomerase
MNLHVDVISDVICPWCFIGKRRLEKAIALLGDDQNVQVHWHPFQLNPALPQEGIPRREYRTRKFGSWQRSQELDARVRTVGDAEGIQFDFDSIEWTPNTRDAHRVIWLAGEHDCQDAVVEALFLAYFTEGRNIGLRQELLSVVVAAGLDEAMTTAMLDSDQGGEIFETAGRTAQQHGVTGVPFFNINQTVSLSGAQDPTTFIDAFRQVGT